MPFSMNDGEKMIFAAMFCQHMWEHGDYLGATEGARIAVEAARAVRDSIGSDAKLRETMAAMIGLKEDA